MSLRHWMMKKTALILFHTALEGAKKIDIHRLRAECMGGIGDIMKHRGNIVEAKEMWEAAIPLFIRSSQTKAAAVVEAQLAELALAQDHQEERINHPVITDSQGTAKQEESGSRKLKQLTHLSAPQNSPSTVVEGSRQPSSANSPASNATESWVSPYIICVDMCKLCADAARRAMKENMTQPRVKRGIHIIRVKHQRPLEMEEPGAAGSCILADFHPE
ncbi:hypothetical protein B0H14DRAFT_2648996 [Mycena olivaceomarginata]|nr:hypothetical protein B0H14DRAFT_2648996 [Mycena olivaceomarginata]